MNGSNHNPGCLATCEEQHPCNPQPNVTEATFELPQKTDILRVAEELLFPTCDIDDLRQAKEYLLGLVDLAYTQRDKIEELTQAHKDACEQWEFWQTNAEQHRSVREEQQREIERLEKREAYLVRELDACTDIPSGDKDGLA